MARHLAARRKSIANAGAAKRAQQSRSMNARAANPLEQWPLNLELIQSKRESATCELHQSFIELLPRFRGRFGPGEGEGSREVPATRCVRLDPVIHVAVCTHVLWWSLGLRSSWRLTESHPDTARCNWEGNSPRPWTPRPRGAFVFDRNAGKP